VIIKEEI